MDKVQLSEAAGEAEAELERLFLYCLAWSVGGLLEPADRAKLDAHLRALGAEGRAGLRASRDALKALRLLVAADIALARAALLRALVGVALAVIFGGSAWLLLMAALIAALQALGLSWLAALLVTALLSLVVTAASALAAMRYFEHSSMRATRRQLARLGLGALDELEALLRRDAQESPDTEAEAAANADGDGDAHVRPNGAPTP
ncbi:MAG: hypothetical protein ACK4MU_07190 [Thermomonas sp.]